MHTIYCANTINSTQVDNGLDIDVVNPRYNLMEYSNNYSETPGSLRQYYRDKPANVAVNSD